MIWANSNIPLLFSIRFMRNIADFITHNTKIKVPMLLNGFNETISWNKTWIWIWLKSWLVLVCGLLSSTLCISDSARCVLTGWQMSGKHADLMMCFLSNYFWVSRICLKALRWSFVKHVKPFTSTKTTRLYQYVSYMLWLMTFLTMKSWEQLQGFSVRLVLYFQIRVFLTNHMRTCNSVNVKGESKTCCLSIWLKSD